MKFITTDVILRAMKLKTAIIALILSSFFPLWANSFPLIPDGEVIRYKTIRGKRGEDVQYSSQSIYRINEEGMDFYLIKSNSPDQLSETRLTVEGFIPLSVTKQQFGGRSDIITATELTSVPPVDSHEIPLLDMEDLAHVLRAYPFDNPQDMEILFLGQNGEGMEDMTFRILYEGEETISLGNRQIEAWKLELKADLSGAMRLFAAMIPKTYMWFSQEPSRHLLKMSGSEGPGADKEFSLEMISYTS